MQSKLLKLLLGKHITFFIKQKGPNDFEVEIADSEKRKKLLVLNIQKLTASRCRLKDYQSF